MFFSRMKARSTMIKRLIIKGRDVSTGFGNMEIICSLDNILREC